MFHTDQHMDTFESQITEVEEYPGNGVSAVQRAIHFNLRCRWAAVLASGAAA